MKPKAILQGILVVAFIYSLGYFFYVFTFNLISGPGFTDDLKTALVIAGLSIGMLYLVRDRTTPDLSPPEALPPEDQPSEESPEK